MIGSMMPPPIPLWARLGALIALLIAWPALAAGVVTPAPRIGAGLALPVAMKCSHLVSGPGGETLVNTCDMCRIVTVQRKRPGADAPISRTLTVGGQTRNELSFRGPGHSRIIADVPCRQKQPGASPTPGGEGEQRCIMMQQAGGRLALFNLCEECRAVVVERIDKKGGRRMQTLSVGGKSAAPLESQGATGARILSEKSCK